MSLSSLAIIKLPEPPKSEVPEEGEIKGVPRDPSPTLDVSGKTNGIYFLSVSSLHFGVGLTFGLVMVPFSFSKYPKSFRFWSPVYRREAILTLRIEYLYLRPDAVITLPSKIRLTRSPTGLGHTKDPHRPSQRPTLTVNLVT